MKSNPMSPRQLGCLIAACSIRHAQRMAVAAILVLAASTATHAGGIIHLTPDSPPPYSAEQTVQVDISLENVTLDTLRLDFVRLDYSDTDPDITMPRTMTWLLNPPGSGYRILPGPFFDASDPDDNVVQPLDTILLGRITVATPDMEGCYPLDVMNDDDSLPTHGAEIRWLDNLGNNYTWRAETGELTGGILYMPVGTIGDELCNGIDDDCDGEIDEGFTQTQLDPYTGEFIEAGPLDFCVINQGICEVLGELVCSADGLSLECLPLGSPAEPLVEGPYLDPSCYNLDDDDCDGLPDFEDPDCQGAEVCDGFDNDWNGEIDERWPTLGQACTAGMGPCTQTGVFICRDDGTGVRCSAEPLPAGTEGPPAAVNCSDTFDNDCDDLVDLDDPDCQMTEICDGMDNDGDSEIDEDFPLLGQICGVGTGYCARLGFYVCRADGTGVTCSSTPGAPAPEGSGCDCGDTIDNDCDGLTDLDDPDCGGHIMRVEASLPLVCSSDDSCCTRHTVKWQTINGGPNLVETAELLAVDSNGTILDSAIVALGDQVRITSRSDPSELHLSSGGPDELSESFYDTEFEPCMLGPDAPLTPLCRELDTDCDGDLDLADAAWFQRRFGQPHHYHLMTAPIPVLRVTANNGLAKATAYASPVPHVRVWSPDETVVSLSEGDRIKADVALAEIDLATLEAKLDGVDLFAALGLNPATDFPGGPYGGSVTLPNGCTANICELIVDGADFQSNASNSLSMFVEDMCCGGHRLFITGQRTQGMYPAPPPTECYDGDLTDSRASYGLAVDIVWPTEGYVDPAAPTFVSGTACYGKELPPVDAGGDPVVMLNGGQFPLSLLSATPGDGVYTADKYVYLFGADVPLADMFQDAHLGNGTPGTLDPGGNILIGEVVDDKLNAAHDSVAMGVTPEGLTPKSGTRSVISRGLAVTITEPALDTAVTEALKPMADLVVQQIENTLNEMKGKKTTLPADGCDPKVTILTNSPIPVSFSMDPSAFTYDVTPVTDQVNLTVTSGPASLSGSVKGDCEIEGIFGECFLRVIVKIGLTVDVAQAQVSVAVTETDLLTQAVLTPKLLIDNNDVNVSVADVGSDLTCWGGELFNLLSFGTAEGILSDIIEDYLQDYLDGLDVTPYLALVPVPPIPLNVIDFQPVDIGTLNVVLNFDMTEVEITPSGLAVGFSTEFIPTAIDPEVREVPEFPQTIASLPMPPLASAQAKGITALVSDDAINQLLYALTRNGLFMTEFEDVRIVQDLLPIDCSSLPTPQLGQCEAFKGTPCATLTDPQDQSSCQAAQALFEDLNIDANTAILLHGRLDAAPKLLIPEPGPFVPPSATVYLRLSQAYVGIVADRDGDGLFTGDYTALPSCFAAPSTATECTVWGTCHDVTLTGAISLTTGPGGVPRLVLDVLDAELSTATGCSGGTTTPGGLGAFESIFEGLVFDLISSYVDNNVPPIDLQGLDFNGIITLDNLGVIRYGNDCDPFFKDTFGLTADPAPSP